MGAFSEQLLLAVTTPILGLAILAEIAVSAWQGRRAYTLRQTSENVFFAFCNGSLDLLLRGAVLWALTFFFTHRIVTLERGWIYWTALLVLEDFAYWLLHYVDHRCRFFWAVHVTHHSSDEFNLTTGFRSSVFQPLYRTAYFAPLAWFGFQPLDILFMYAATQLWGVLVHTECVRKLGWLEHLLVTPSHHRVHHASNPRYLDKNMGMIFIVWDKLFGTFEPEDEAEPPRYGLTKAPLARDPFTLIFHEWRSIAQDVRHHAKNWREKLAYIFAPPGWKP